MSVLRQQMDGSDIYLSSLQGSNEEEIAVTKSIVLSLNLSQQCCRQSGY